MPRENLNYQKYHLPSEMEKYVKQGQCSHLSFLGEGTAQNCWRDCSEASLTETDQ